MRLIITLFFLFVIFLGYSQNPGLAKNYFDQGEFEKALSIYEKLYKAQPNRTEYFVALIKSHQQLEQFSEVEKLIEERLRRNPNAPDLYVDLGYNFQLQRKMERAKENYRLAIEAIRSKPNLSYNVGRKLQSYNLLEEAIEVYQIAMEENDRLDFSMQIAQIYGELGNLEKMFESYLAILEKDVNQKANAQRYFRLYIEEDANNEANKILNRILLRRIQKNPEILYYDLLSWLYIQEKEYKKAFVQERAIFRREGENNFDRIIHLANIAMSDEDFDSAKEIVDYVVTHAFTPQLKLQGQKILMQIEVTTAKKEKYPEIEKKFQQLFEEFGKDKNTLNLQIIHNRFLAFEMNNRSLAIDNLRALMKKSLNAFEEARVKMELADILVFEEQFNQALILYSQIQSSVQSDVLAQEARFKVARTSYFKGDFDWALTQLDVLKRSTSQLIANDAMELSMLIKDNSWEDTTQVALKKYARAELYEIQGKNKEALDLLEKTLAEHKGESIEDEVLLKLGDIYERMGAYEKAEKNYLSLLENFSEDILADDALFKLAKLYENRLNQPEKAKIYYEKILFEHADSIYFVEARRNFRRLRGDLIN